MTYTTHHALLRCLRDEFVRTTGYAHTDDMTPEELAALVQAAQRTSIREAVRAIVRGHDA